MCSTAWPGLDGDGGAGEREPSYGILGVLYNCQNSPYQQERPYHSDSTASRLLSEVKHCRARLVLRWGTTLESLVLFFCSFALSMCLSESLRLFAPSQSHLPADSSFSLMIFLLAFTGFIISCCSFPPSPFIVYSSWPSPSLLYYLHLINSLVCSAPFITHPMWCCFLFMPFFIPSVITIIMLLSCHCHHHQSDLLYCSILIMLSSCTFSRVLAKPWLLCGAFIL